MSIVKKLLGEAPVEPQDVGNPGGGDVPVYRVIKGEDAGISESFQNFLDAAANDFSLIGVGELQQMQEELRLDDAEECNRLIALMERLKADYILL